MPVCGSFKVSVYFPWHYEIIFVNMGFRCSSGEQLNQMTSDGVTWTTLGHTETFYGRPISRCSFADLFLHRGREVFSESSRLVKLLRSRFVTAEILFRLAGIWLAIFYVEKRVRGVGAIPVIIGLDSIRASDVEKPMTREVFWNQRSGLGYWRA